MTSHTRATLDLVYFNAGGGHRAAAQALEAVIHQQGRPWRVRCLNLMEVLDPRGRFRELTGMAPEDLYNKRLAKGWTLGLAQELKLLQGMIRLGHPALVRALQQHWLRDEPDLVVSLVPNFNRAMAEGLASALPGVPYVTVLTDLADHPPHFWIEPSLAAHPQVHLVCGSAQAEAQALAAGYPAAQVHRTSGMLLRPDFYEPLTLDRRAERLALGLDPDRPTGVVMFGGQGSLAMLPIARELHDVQLLLMCGHHQVLADKLRAHAANASARGFAPRAVVGFTPEVRRHLALGDFFIGKPGPGSLSEAVQQGLPVVTVRNAWTMPQERYNTEWVRELGVGVVGSSMRQLRTPVQALLARLDAFKAAARQVDNRAVFEVPEILDAVLQGSAHPRAPGGVAARQGVQA